MTLIVYTGEGKGKTTASIGLAIRYLVHNKTVKIVTFLKPEPSGEDLLFEDRIPKVMHSRMLFKYDVYEDQHENEILSSISRYMLNETMNYIKEKQPDLVIMDEINICLFYGYITRRDIVSFLKVCKEYETDCVFTGRYAPEWLKPMASIYTEMTKVKHDFDEGVQAREGIEY